jgi:hypothetical protein
MRRTKSGLKATLTLAAVVGGLAFVSPPARADEVVARETIYAGPNRALLWTGVFTAGVPYVASAVVGAESGYTPDRSIFIPFAGPWVDLAQRSGCPIAAASCNGETADKVLLVADGIFQGIGAITIVSAFLFPERSAWRARRAAAREIHFSPLTLRQGGGLTAFGTF